jgi:hypothetical protein
MFPFIVAYVFIENVFGSKDRVERKETWGSALVMGKSLII